MAAVLTTIIVASCGTAVGPKTVDTSATVSSPLTVAGPVTATSTLALKGCRPRTPSTLTMTVPSAALGGSDKVLVHLPPCGSHTVYVLYLLHGAGADRTQWPDVGVLDAVNLAEATRTKTGSLPVVVVVPDAKPSYDCPQKCGAPLLRHVLDEIEPAVRQMGYVVRARAIGGISRGGGLAFDVAAEKPRAFAAVGGHSPASVQPSTELTLARARVPVWLDVGTSDGLDGRTIALSDRLRADGGNVVLSRNSGGHNRPYWRGQVTRYVAWYLDRLERHHS